MKFVFLYGAPGTGKLTVAKELAHLTGYTLFHNHMILNALSEIFGYDNPTRGKLEKEFRLRIVEEAVKANVKMIWTGVIMRDNEEFYRKMVQTVKENHGQCLLVYLTVSKEELENRIGDESRRELKKISTLERLEEWARQYPESFEKIDYDEQYTCDTSNITPHEVAIKIIDHYKLK